MTFSFSEKETTAGELQDVQQPKLIKEQRNETVGRWKRNVLLLSALLICYSGKTVLQLTDSMTQSTIFAMRISYRMVVGTQKYK